MTENCLNCGHTCKLGLGEWCPNWKSSGDMLLDISIKEAERFKERRTEDEQI